MRLRPRQTARLTASRLLPRLAEEFFEAGDELVTGAAAADRVHPFRVLTKRFRYALEYFQACYGAAMGSRLKTIKELQQVLGELTDCSSTRALLDRQLHLSDNPRYQTLYQALQGREGEATARFQTLWRTSFQNPMTRRKLLQYLTHPRQEPRPARKNARRGAAPRRANKK